MSPDEGSLPRGLASYDRIMAQGDQKYNVGDFRREREAIDNFIADDEPVVGRHFASEVAHGSNGDLLHRGAVFLSTDRKLLMVSAHGMFRPKFRVDEFGYSVLKPGVGSRDGELFGNPVWHSGFGTKDGDTYLLRFHSSHDRDLFVEDVGGALGAWHVIHGST